MLHWAIFPATCIATKLPVKLQERLPSVTAPLKCNISIAAVFISQFCFNRVCGKNNTVQIKIP